MSKRSHRRKKKRTARRIPLFSTEWLRRAVHQMSTRDGFDYGDQVFLPRRGPRPTMWHYPPVVSCGESFGVSLGAEGEPMKRWGRGERLMRWLGEDGRVGSIIAWIIGLAWLVSIVRSILAG